MESTMIKEKRKSYEIFFKIKKVTDGVVFVLLLVYKYVMLYENY